MELLLQIRSLVFSRTAKATSYIFAGNAASSLLAIVFTILAARFLGTDNWGLVAAVTSLIPILVAFADFGIGSALFQYAAGKWLEKEKLARMAYKTFLAARILTLFIFSFFLLVLARPLSRLIFNLQDENLIVWATFGLVAVSLFDFQILIIQSRQRWRTAAAITVVVNTLRLIFVLMLLQFRALTVASTLFVWIAGSFGAFLISLKYLGHFPKFTRGWETLFKQYSRFSSWVSLNKIVSTLASRIDVIILLSLAGASTTGVYAAANRLVMGVPLLAGSLATVLAAKFASIIDKENLKEFFKKSFYLSLFLSLTVLVAGFVLAPYITSLFGKGYEQTTSVFRWLLLAIIPLLLSGPAVNILIYHFKKPSIIAYMAVVQLILVLFINYSFIPSLGVFAPVLALGVAQFSTTFVTYIFALYYLYRK